MITIEEINLLIEKLEKAKATDFAKLLESNIKDLKTIKKTIERIDQEVDQFQTRDQNWFRKDLEEKKGRQNLELLYKAIKDKIWKFAKTNEYNSLEIGPGNGDFSNLFTAWRRQFFLDIMWDIEKNVRFKFQRGGQQKHMTFYKTDGYHCGKVPTKSVNFIFSWDTFVFFNLGQIERYLDSMNKVLIPGGYCFIQYSDCHFDYDLQMSKKGYWAYNNKSAMTELIKRTGFVPVEMSQFKPGANYAIFKKPGNINPTVYKISELTLD